MAAAERGEELVREVLVHSMLIRFADNRGFKSLSSSGQIRQRFFAMTDEQLKQLASITLLNSDLISRLCASSTSLLEQVLPLLPEKEHALKLLSDIEQLQAHVESLQPALAQARKELGLGD